VCACACASLCFILTTKYSVVFPVQLAERAVFQMKQHGGEGSLDLPSVLWQLEEAQVFWAKGEQGLALGLLRQMIHNLEDKVRPKHTDRIFSVY